MCTAATYRTKDFYFGRTLDYGFSYGEEITVTPRNYPFRFGGKAPEKGHYALIGTAYVADGYPLYYDAANEKGLAMAGLNFVGNAVYRNAKKGKDNIAQYELIPWILSRCSSVKEAKTLLKNLNVTGEAFREDLPPASLHWMIADKTQCITVEPLKEGLKVWDNPVGVLTNNPPFELQMFALNNYMGLSAKLAKNTFAKGLRLRRYSLGLGAMGLPGDNSSQSRFVRAAFVKLNSASAPDELSSVSQYFHILGAVDFQRGCCETEDGKHEVTIYTSCINTEKGNYYYTAYDNRTVTAVDLHRENLRGERLIRYPMLTKGAVCFQN